MASKIYHIYFFNTIIQTTDTIVNLPCRFSGISEEDMEDVTTTIRDVQAVLLSLLSDKTILMGHSLESDLRALKVSVVEIPN